MRHHVVHFALTVLLAAAALLGTALSASSAGVAGGSTVSTPSGVTGAWEAQSSRTQQALFGVACFDARRCKAVGAGGTVLYTKNGGRTWRPQSTPLTGTSTILYRIACLGHSTCYVIGRPNIILVTHNGGVSWSVHHIPLSGSGSALTDAACVSAQTYDIRVRLALCRLGLLDLACLRVSTCFVVATVHVQAQFGDLGPALFLTTDGGVTWTSQSIPTTAPCEGDCGPAGVRVPYPLEWITCGPGSLCRAGGSTFIGSHEGYATLVIAARKPGAPWTPLQQSYTNGAVYPAPDSAVCPTATRCSGVWTTSPFQPGNEIWLSTDGGWTWQGMSSGSPKLRNAITCPAATTCYSVGNQGTITASSNGGPFLAQPSHTSHDLYGVTCVDVQTCVAVGNKGTIVSHKTTSRTR
jgi:photosystem II stability/assembly factor-like uncharacterized protein